MFRSTASKEMDVAVALVNAKLNAMLGNDSKSRRRDRFNDITAVYRSTIQTRFVFQIIKISKLIALKFTVLPKTESIVLCAVSCIFNNQMLQTCSRINVSMFYIIHYSVNNISTSVFPWKFISQEGFRPPVAGYCKTGVICGIVIFALISRDQYLANSNSSGSNVYAYPNFVPVREFILSHNTSITESRFREIAKSRN